MKPNYSISAPQPSTFSFGECEHLPTVSNSTLSIGPSVQFVLGQIVASICQYSLRSPARLLYLLRTPFY